PEMWARAKIRIGDGTSALAIPRGALLEDGRTSQVLLALGDGRFQPRAITPGRRFGDWVEVRSGLRAGERVVSSAQFLIDSESDLQAELQRLSGSGQVPGVHHHGH
ncbi:MAG: efflux RND transporter periplasmic adaptor subunit, partial [Pseudomonadota bacterium]